MRPPAGGGPVLSNQHDNGKTYPGFYRIPNNINRLNRILKRDWPDRRAPGQSQYGKNGGVHGLENREVFEQ
jgi:hypothetical protein